MYGEFCFLLDKRGLLGALEKCPDYGSLLEAQTQNYKLGEIHVFLRSYELKASEADGNITLLFGDAIYRSKLYQDAQQIEHDQLDVADFIENARGSFLLVKIDTQSNTVSLYNDLLSLYPVYWFENEQYAALSNMPIWMESVLSAAGVEVARDGLLAGYDLAIGTGAFGVTGWSEFHLIPFGTSLTLTQTKLEFNELRALDRFFNTNDSLDALIEKSAIELKENVKAIAGSHHANKVSDITGGMDSRLVLAAILSQGLEDQFLYHTNGEYPVPDANCALSIMEKFGLTRIRTSCQYSQPVATKPISTFRKFVYQSQGSRFICDRAFETNCVQDDLIKVGGGLAGGFKSTYSLRLKAAEDKQVSLEDAVSAMFLPATERLSASLVSRIREELASEFSGIHERYKVSYKAAMDFFYVLSRNRYFIGMGEFPNSAVRPKVHALYSQSLISAGLMLQDDERGSGKLHFELMKRLSPSLCKLPFAGQSWSESIVNAESDMFYMAGAPITVKSAKLYNNVDEKRIELSSAPQEEDEEEVINKDEEWRKKQKDLGRNWMWRNFDSIYFSSFALVNKSNSLEGDVFKSGHIREVFKKPYYKFSRANEIRSLLFITHLSIFRSSIEKPSKVFFCGGFEDAGEETM
ncbi:hypothetical protein [Halomonas piscis]|uniref:hypothetical protein n=1 Tax=Halomonas piscis TaxID=3031727 RepID=UPI00289F2E5A|nr:hypothetical protein [Halomonas piscis]